MKQGKTKIRRAIVIVAFVTLFGSGAPSVIAQPLHKTVAMVGARSGASWPLWIAKEARLYAKYGLDVELVYAVHPAPIAAIITGQAAMTSSGSDPALARSRERSFSRRARRIHEQRLLRA